MRAQQNHFHQLKVLEHLAPLIMLYATVSNQCGIAINVKKTRIGHCKSTLTFFPYKSAAINF